MPAALIVGAFGQDNPGDEALLDSTVAAVRAQQGWEPVVATARPGETTERLGVAAVAGTPVATLRAAAIADALVVGGGTLFKELHPTSGRSPGGLLRSALGLTSAFRARRRPVAMLGVGAARITSRTNQQLARVLAGRADLLVLRDADSAVILAGLGVPAPLRVGADLAWMSLPAATGSATHRPRGSLDPIGVAISHLCDAPGLVDRLAAALRPLVDAGRPVEIEPWQGSPYLSQDGQMARRLQAAVGAGTSVIPPPESLIDASARMAGRAAGLTLRFHGAVAAAHAGTPFLALAHEPKLASISRHLGQLAVGPDAQPEVITHGLRQALLSAPPSIDALREEHRKAAASAELLGLVLTGAGDGDELVHLDLIPEPVPS